MFKVNNKATEMTPLRFGGFIVKFEHISHLCSSVSTVNFEHVIPGLQDILTLQFLAKDSNIKCHYLFHYRSVEVSRCYVRRQMLSTS